MIQNPTQSAQKKIETAFLAGQFQDLWEACSELLALSPDYAPAVNLAGLAAVALGREAEGLDLLRRSTRLEPSNPALWLNLAAELSRLRNPEMALEIYLRPEVERWQGPALLGQANCLVDLNRHEEAAARLRNVPSGAQEWVPAMHSLATVLLAQGRWQAARELLDGPLGGFRDADSTRLFALIHDPDLTVGEIREAHEVWGRRFPQPPAPRPRNADRGRRLRVGYVSPDFRRHSCAYFLEPVLAAHDRREIEVFAYPEVASEDAFTARFKSLSDHWWNTSGRSDAAFADRVAEDQIDILVDLAGHTSGNRLRVFARRPAPIQLTWLGYPCTTGLNAFSGRLTDAWADPPGSEESATEPLLRLPHFLCYSPPQDAVTPRDPPCMGGAPPTFASFNSPSKLNRGVLQLWGRLLRQVPEARLLLKGRGLGDPETQAWIRGGFREQGIAGGRIAFLEWIPNQDSPLAGYHNVDVALDPFPYNGTTTTFEALWMGVPVVVLQGDRHSGRVGTSILRGIERTEWIAQTETDYLRIARTLITDPELLKAHRQTLRATLGSSPLLDSQAFCRALEQQYRQLWHQSLQADAPLEN